MELPPPGSSQPSLDVPAFSEDILQIELAGPRRSHFSIMDIPGIFRSPIPGVTTENDRKTVKQMVKRAVKDRRTIILAVLPANVDIATQEIIEFAKEADPSGSRTLGVLTKPDLVDEGSEQDVIRLLEGKKKPLRLGYTIVRNRKQNEYDYTIEQRHLKEAEFFQDGPFSVVGKAQVGISALLPRLRDLLRRITRESYPYVCQEIQKTLDEANKALAQLGPSRTIEYEQRGYLATIAEQYQQAVLHAVAAQYSHSDCFRQNQSTRLATRLVDLNNEFSRSMDAYGSAAPFQNELAPDEKPAVVAQKKNNSGETDTYPLFSQSSQQVLDECRSQNDTEETVDTPTSEDIHLGTDDIFRGLESLTSIHPVAMPRRRGIIRWLTKEYHESRGFELGSFNPSIISHMFFKLTRSWEPLTRNHIAKCIKTVHQFSHDILQYYVPDERVRSELLETLSEHFKKKYRDAHEQAELLLYIERHGTLMTTNHYFAQNIEKAHRDRQVTLITKCSQQLTYTDRKAGEKTVQTFDKAAFLNTSQMSNDEYNVQMIHDALQSYYKVARKRFVDYICMQAIDHHLVSGPGACLRLFSTEFALGLPREQVESIACESSAVREQRQSLQTRVDSLKRGMTVLYSY